MEDIILNWLGIASVVTCVIVGFLNLGPFLEKLFSMFPTKEEKAELIEEEV
jgi:hypothetical protein